MRRDLEYIRDKLIPKIENRLKKLESGKLRHMEDLFNNGQSVDVTETYAAEDRAALEELRSIVATEGRHDG